MNILLAADGSEYSRKAARSLARLLSEGRKAQVHVLHVHAPLPYPGAAAQIGKGALERYQEEESLKALSVAQEELDRAGVTYKTHWTVGDVVHAIRDFSKKNAIDVVVMGTRGHTGVAGVAMGSVTQKVIANCEVPVLLVP
jgi:nucleotide-binding universal stress UspA family protein